MAVVTANLVGSDLGTVSEQIVSELEAMNLPTGYDWRIGGQRQEMETSFDSMRLAILLAIFMVYLVMASQFESLLHPLVILFSVPFALIGLLGTLFCRITHLDRGADRRHSAGRYRGQQRHHPGGLHQPAAAPGHVQARGPAEGRARSVCDPS